MTGEDDIQFLAPDTVTAQIAAEPELSVRLNVTGIPSDQLGSFLDVIEHIAHAMKLDVVLDAPGYIKAFYGWEKDVWRD